MIVATLCAVLTLVNPEDVDVTKPHQLFVNEEACEVVVFTIDTCELPATGAAAPDLTPTPLGVGAEGSGSGGNTASKN
jgi:hypothetical protein